ncbi:MAG: glycerol-3-phosphate 1-O-acyltransferase PlsY [bacterium]
MLAYLVGSIPFGLLVGWFRNIDLRRKGSGNIGTVNAYRVLGILPAIGIFLLDFSKGFLPTFLAAPLVTPEVLALVGLSTVIGHDYSIFLGFRGGKGIATTAGVVAALDWRIIAAAISIWLVCILLSRIPSISSLAASFSLIPFFLLWQPSNTMLAIILFGLALIAHQTNLDRLARGEERGFNTELPTPRRKLHDPPR